MTNAVGQVPGNLLDWAAGVIGVPVTVVSAQISEESGGDPAAVSSAGAVGAAQFEPGTWRQLGCPGSPYNVNDAMRCYAKYMYQLVQQYHGNVRDALAAYNAGPANLSAGYGYADTILRNAGQPGSLAAKGGNPASAQPGSSTPGQGGADCAWSVGGAHLNLFFGHGPSLPSACLIRKTEIRAMMGGLLLVAGGLVALPGLVIILAAGFRGSGAQQAATRAAGMLPGPVGRIANVAGAAGAGAGSRPRQRPRTQPTRPGQPLSDAEVQQARANRRRLDSSAGRTAQRPQRPAPGRYRVTERTPLSGEMGGTRTVSYTTSRRPRRARETAA